MSVFEEQIRAYAKINLFLRVCGKREDGYHLLSTLMQSVSLFDEITVRCSDSAAADGFEPGITLSTNIGYLPNNAKNTAYKAARAFLDALDKKDISVTIHIRKQIPTQAGLGGGSTDAAAVLAALSHMFPGTVQRDELFTIAAGIGADVPFCMDGGTQMCEGIGDILTPAASLSGVPILLIKPPCGISTPRAFAKYDEKPILHVESDAGKAAVERLRQNTPGANPVSKITDAAPYLYNDLESVAETEFPVLAEIRTFLVKQGAIFAGMSGSGSTVFGIFADKEKRDAARRRAGDFAGKEFMLFSGELV